MNVMQAKQSDLDLQDRAKAVRDMIWEAIVDRRLAPGLKLSEAEVGKLFDVSRSVVRDALQMLAFEGLIHTERNRGAFVSSPSPEEARQIFASRRLIEPGIIVAAAAHLSPDDISRLRAHLQQEEHLRNRRGAQARHEEIKASGDFHLMLAQMGGNAILRKFMDELIARSSLVIALYGRTGISSCARDEHTNIVDALEARDQQKATELVLHHIDHIESDLDLRSIDSLSLSEALKL